MSPWPVITVVVWTLSLPYAFALRQLVYSLYAQSLYNDFGTVFSVRVHRLASFYFKSFLLSTLYDNRSPLAWGTD